MTIAEDHKAESRPFEADVAKLLHLMVHSVYSDKSVFLRELIANAADACERLRYEAIAEPALLGEDTKLRITVALDPQGRRLTVEDNGIGMSRDEMIESLLRHQGVPRPHRGGATGQGGPGKRGQRADRAVRRRLLFGLHGRPTASR
jgi:hypothetical protein